jgi:membrane-associated protease RseP (regulator of RpoE activity)
MTTVVFAVLTLAVMMALNFTYCWSMAWLGNRVGIAIDVVSVGLGKPIVRWQGARWPYQIGWIPLGGYTKFRGEVEAPQSIHNAGQSEVGFNTVPALYRRTIVLTGPLVVVVIGLGVLALPVAAEAPALIATTPEDAQVKPSGIGDLKVAPAPVTWDAQFRLFRDTAGNYVYRLLTFQSLEGWSGPVGGCITCGIVAEQSIWCWVSLLGVLGVLLGVMNLLPIPAMNGFHAIGALGAAITGRRAPENVQVAMQLVGVLFTIVIGVRCLALDAVWVWHLIVG